MINIIQKTATILLGIAIAVNLSGIVLIAYAATCTDADQSGCTSTNFSVGTYLRADGQKASDAAYKASIQGGLGAVVVSLINQLSYVIGSFALIALIIGGFTYMTSSGQERLATKAKGMITNAIIGLVVALSAFYITLYVQSIFYEK
jgi:hypothetical protein